MKTRLTILLLTLFIGANLLFAQPKDVPGYSKTRWGMTEQEIKDAMKEEAIPLKGKKKFGFTSYATLGMKDISIDSNDFIGHFLMNDKTDRLSQVNIDIIAQNIDDNFDSFNSMVKALSKEYGKPTALYTSIYPGAKRPISKVVWMFPSTIILYISWGQDLDKSMLQFFENNGKRNLNTLGFIPVEEKKTPQPEEKAIKTEEKKEETK